MSEQTTARMIDAIEHPLVDQCISVTKRAQPWVDELLAEAWDEGVNAGRRWPDDAKARNPYRSQGES